MNQKKTGLQSWFQLASIQIGGAICLPVLFIGTELGKAHGFASAACSIIIGNGLLMLLGIIQAHMTWSTKVPTIEQARIYFTKYAQLPLILTVVGSMLGWFAIQLNLITDSVRFIIPTIPTFLLNIVLGSAITYGALFGIKGLQRLATISMPLLIAVIVIAVYRVQIIESTPSPSSLSLSGLSLVLSTAIMAVVDIPTYYLFARSRKDSFISIVLSLFVTLSCIELAGVYIATMSPEQSLIGALSYNTSWIYSLMLTAFLILAGWTTNNANIYSAAITLHHLMPQTTYMQRILCIGTIGTVLSCFTALTYLEPILNGMGIAIASMGAVISIQYILSYKRVKSQYSSEIAWIVGILVGIISMYGVSLFHAPLIDAFAASAAMLLIIYICAYFLKEKK